MTKLPLACFGGDTIVLFAQYLDHATSDPLILSFNVGKEGLPSSLEGVLEVLEGSSSESSIVGSLEASCAPSLIGASIDNAINELLRFGAFYSSFLDSLITMGKGGFKNILQN